MDTQRSSALPPFEPVSNLESAEWLTERLEQDNTLSLTYPDLGWLVPDGFEALVRVFPPLLRQRIVGMSWQELDALNTSWQPGDALEYPEFVNEPVTWAETSEALGQQFQPDISITNLLDIGGRSSADVNEWRYSTDGLTGRLPMRLLSTVASVLAKHTATPSSGIAALWDGYVSHADRVAESLELQMPQRPYMCFEAGVDEFVAPDWGERTPWGPLAGAPEPTNFPNLLWPDDASWLVVNEIDFWSTLIACSHECATELLAHPEIEAALIDRDTRID